MVLRLVPIGERLCGGGAFHGAGGRDAYDGAGALSYEEFVVLAQAEAKMRGTVHPESIDDASRDAVSVRLCEDGLLADGAVTPRGLAALEPYRAKRAVLLAAGFGSRLLPVTVNTPKPLARVHGVRIIDRLIDAVMAAGIDEIYIVRGYLAEEFDQLLSKYPNLHFIDNPVVRPDEQHFVGSGCMRAFRACLRLRERFVPHEPDTGEQVSVSVELPGLSRRENR